MLPDGLLAVRFHHVCDDDVSGVFSVDGHVDDGTHAVAVVVGDAQVLHELVVAGRDLHAVHLCGDAVAADLLDVGDPGAVDFLAVGALEALADGMGGGAFRQRAYSSSFSSLMSLWWMPLTSNTPWVSVPVLSKTRVLTCDSVSR